MELNEQSRCFKNVQTYILRLWTTQFDLIGRPWLICLRERPKTGAPDVHHSKKIVFSFLILNIEFRTSENPVDTFYFFPNIREITLRCTFSVFVWGTWDLEPLKWWELQTACRNGLYSVTDWSVCLSWLGKLHLTEDRDICSYPSTRSGLLHVPLDNIYYYLCHLEGLCRLFTFSQENFGIFWKIFSKSDFVVSLWFKKNVFLIIYIQIFYYEEWYCWLANRDGENREKK